MSGTQWMIYGANGYTGELIAREAAQRGMKPVLAGRRADQIATLAQELGLQHRAFALDDAADVARQLAGMKLVLHCAGPFSSTSAPMVEACLQAQAHYLDITGEIDVFEHAHAQHARAQQAGIVVCPGVGFDVIPTDCVAAALKAALPDATHLALGFDSRTRMSPGSAKTAVESMATGGKVRENGRIIAVPPAWRVRKIDFGDGEKLATTIPWGDVSTAFHSTGIPNIELYIPATRGMISGMKRMHYLRWALALAPVQKFLKARIGKSVKGPSADKRGRAPTYVWGEATNAAGGKKTARIRIPNTYDVTITGALAVVEHLLGARPAPGAYTPSRLLGADLVTRLPECGPMRIT